MPAIPPEELAPPTRHHCHHSILGVWLLRSLLVHRAPKERMVKTCQMPFAAKSPHGVRASYRVRHRRRRNKGWLYVCKNCAAVFSGEKFNIERLDR